MFLQNDTIELRLIPANGGGVASFCWRGHDIFHTRPDAKGPLALGCFALSPFSGRIAKGRFGGKHGDVSLPRNHPSDPDHLHALHGFDWLAPFEVLEASATHAALYRLHTPDEWPWAYESRQLLTLHKSGYVHEVSIRNKASSPMPAGIGLHPYFPRASARLQLDVDGQWETTQEQIPLNWRPLAHSPDWLGAKAFDHCFTGRRGSIVIDWLTHKVTIEPDAALNFAVVFTPPGEGYFCVEPASHMPDAVNRPEPPEVTGLRWLAPGEIWKTRTTFMVSGQ